MRRALRWLKRIVLGALALVVVAVVAALIVVHTDWGRGKIRAEIERQLAAVFPGARVGTVEGSVLGELVVRGLEIPARGGVPRIAVATLRVELAFTPLLGKTVVVERVVAEDVAVVVPLHPPPAAPEPPPSTPSAPSEPSAWSVALPDIEVRRAAIVIEQAAEPVTLELAEAGAALWVQPDGSLLAGAAVRGRWRERDADVRARVIARLAADGTLQVPLAAVVADGGGATVVAADVTLGATPSLAVTGRATVAATAATIARLVPGVTLPADVRAGLEVAPRGSALHVAVAGRLGGDPLSALVLADPEARTARGVLAATGVELAPWTARRITGRGAAVVAFHASLERVQATVAARAEGGPARAAALVAVDAVLSPAERAHALAIAVADGDARIASVATARRDGDVLVLERSHAAATARDLAAAAHGLRATLPDLPALAGGVALELAASGPTAALAVTASVRGQRLRLDDLRVRGLVARAEATFDPAVVALDPARAIVGTARADVAGIVQAGEPVGAVALTARARGDGHVHVTTTARPAAAPVIVDASARITPGEVLAIALGRHRARTPAGTWSGRGGTIRIDDRRVTIRGVRTGSGTARLAVDATLGLASGNLAVTVDAADVPAALIDPAYRGVASAHLDVTRDRGRWRGGGTLRGQGLVLAEGVESLDGEATLRVDGRRVAVTSRAGNARLGGVRVALEVDGPRDVTDVRAWRRVKRGELRLVTLGFDRVDLAAASGGATGGTIDGTLEIRDGAPSGALAIRDVATPAGDANADLTLALEELGFVDVAADARIGAVGAATLGARLRIPDRPFDPVAWQRLGRGVVHAATARADDVKLDGPLLARLGIDLPYRGRATVTATVGAGASAARVVVDAREVKGGQLMRPLDVHLEAAVDGNGTTAALRVAAYEFVILDVADARTPVTLDRWIETPARALAAPLAATVTLPRTPARDLLGLIGRRDVTQGTLEGKIGIAGTIGTPTGRGVIDLREIRVPPPVVGKPAPMLSELHVDASWGGAAGHVKITGTEEGKGTLLVDVAGRPDELASVLATVKIVDFDVAPIAVFLPGPLVAARGKLDADLTSKGFDPTRGTTRGHLTLTGGRVPLTPTIGTLRSADAKLEVSATGITARLDGKIGPGKVAFNATSALDGSRVTFRGELAKVTPIGAVQPAIDGVIVGSLRREDERWVGKATVSGGSIRVPTQLGNELLDDEAPSDLYFVDRPLPPPRRGRRAPEKPFLVLDVEVEPVQISVPDFAVDAHVGGDLVVKVGDGVGLDGELAVERGSLELNGHRYRVDRGTLTFDGTTDALVDLRLAHDFPAMTMYVRYTGRVDEIGDVPPELSSEPGSYSQGQLFGFFLGGAPGGDPSRQAQEAVAGLASSLAVSTLNQTRLGRTVKRISRLDVLRCEPSAGQSSGSCTAGKWLSNKTFVTYSIRNTARPDQNRHEAKAEYYWKPNRVLELSGGDAGYYGIDLLWRRRW